MKKMMKFGLVMAALLAMAVTTFANTTDFSVRVNDNIGKTIRFSVVDAPTVHLSLVSDQDEILFEENAFGTGAISRQYDLKSFPAGTYFLKAESASKISVYKVDVTADDAIITKTPATEVVKPVVAVKDAKVSISIINSAVTPISITLLDASNVELFTETTPEKLSHIKMFDFSNVPYGEYTFITKYGDETFMNRVVAGN
ncbi:hypothetical protein [Flavobacterium silvaticum]|uniref:Por secretion system C-terminal sorting domain-containing protein n=1 Tax=Flavobacterium silvaticum TaxID=1852020 RepID=A0A972FRU1_9FLAO|nr:hypothetical protein [Flavobacterium silvaticum]NMH28204.1 hypothetical protein [Flavobacterium silvaticum]